MYREEKMKQKLDSAIKEKSYEFSNAEWKDASIEKYHIIQDFEEGEDNELVVLSDDIYKHCGGIYFKTEEDAQYIIDNYKEEILKYLI